MKMGFSPDLACRAQQQAPDPRSRRDRGIDLSAGIKC